MLSNSCWLLPPATILACEHIQSRRVRLSRGSLPVSRPRAPTFRYVCFVPIAHSAHNGTLAWLRQQADPRRKATLPVASTAGLFARTARSASAASINTAMARSSAECVSQAPCRRRGRRCRPGVRPCLIEITQLAHHRRARHPNGASDLLCGRRRAAQRANSTPRARRMGGFGERTSYSAVELLARARRRARRHVSGWKLGFLHAARGSPRVS